MGRPKLPEAERDKVPIMIRLSEAQIKRGMHLAAESGCTSIREWVARLVTLAIEAGEVLHTGQDDSGE